MASPRDAERRLRPAFAIPWLDTDSGGSRLGILSVPLVDEMQNESLRLHTGYGLGSRFPHLALTATSTRFFPVYSLDVFRYQVWNGQEVDPETGDLFSRYVDEKGVAAHVQVSLLPLKSTIQLSWTNSVVESYLGTSREGRIQDVELEYSYQGSSGPWSRWLTLQGNISPKFLNKDFEYQKRGFSLGLAKVNDFLDSRWSLGLRGSRTDGRKTRELQESYQPLQTFIPGATSGYNNLSFPLSLSEKGLFKNRFGQNSARLNSSFDFPLVDDLDWLVKIFYISSLQFKSFFSYGGAWSGGLSDFEAKDDFIFSHSYAADLNFDVKGIHFSAGQGIGQVAGQPLEAFMTFSFDAIF